MILLYLLFAIDYNLSDTSSYKSVYVGVAGANQNIATGDVNGDGSDDLIISYFTVAQNAVYVLFSTNPPGNGNSIDVLTQYDIKIVPESTNHDIGSDLFAGDVNGDGKKDIIIGAMNFSRPDRANCGAIYVIYSTTITGVINLTNGYNLRIDGPAASANMPGLISNLDDKGNRNAIITSDINGDLKEDLIFGSPFSPGGGEAYVIYSVLNQEQQIFDLAYSTAYNIKITGSNKFGWACAAGDLNKDGIKDIVITDKEYDSSNRGAVYVFFGPFNYTGTGNIIPISSASIVILGEYPNHRLGQNITFSDMNNDGYSDLIVSAASASITYVIYSKNISTGTYNISQLYDLKFVGDSLAGISIDAEDVNSDGYSELVIGARNKSIAPGSYQGVVYFFFGKEYTQGSIVNVENADLRFIGENNLVYLGEAVNIGGFHGFSDIEMYSSGKTFTFVIDTTPPLGMIDGPYDFDNPPRYDGLFMSSPTTKFHWSSGTLHDPESGIRYFLVNVSTVAQDGTGSIEKISYSFSYTTSTPLQATYYIRLKPINGVNLEGAWSNWSDGIRIDRTPPAFTVDFNVYFTSMILTITATDTISGLHTTAYAVDNIFQVENSTTFINLTPNSMKMVNIKVRDLVENEDSQNFLKYTLALPPEFSYFHTISSNTIGIAFTASNPSYTRYEILVTTSCDGAIHKSSTTENTSVVFVVNHPANTTYYFEVNSINNDGIKTQGFKCISTATLSNPPTGFYYVYNFTTNYVNLTVNFSTNGNSLITDYTFKLSTSSDFYNSVVAKTTYPRVSFYNLLPDNTYYISGFSTNLNGIPSSMEMDGFITSANIPNSFIITGIPPDSVKIEFSKNGNPDSVSYFIDVSTSFGFEVSTSTSGWIYSTYYTFVHISTAMHYFRIMAKNSEGNLTPYVFAGSFQRDISPPSVIEVIADRKITVNKQLIAVIPGSKFIIGFSEDILPDSLELKIIRTSDTSGNVYNENLSFTKTYSQLNYTILIDSINLLRDSFYRLEVSSGFLDTSFNPAFSGAVFEFRTTISSSTLNNWKAEGVLIEVPAGGIIKPGAFFVRDIENDLIKRAHKKALTHGLQDYIISKEVVFYDENLSTSSINEILLKINYEDRNGDGFIDGTFIKTKLLKVFWLKESEELFVEIPESYVDETSKAVVAPLKHLSIFGVIPLADNKVEDVFAYPVPLIKSNRNKITFTNLPAVAKIEIYTYYGELVYEYEASFPSNQFDWDLKNMDGVEAASGVYIWRVSSGGNSKMGKLVILK